MYRFLVVPMAAVSLILVACAGKAPTPEPGMEVLHFGQGEEMQVTTGVDWSGYTKVILHTAPVEFREHWKADQERILGRQIRESDIERIKTAVSDQLTKVMVKKLSDDGDYQLTDESGAGVMRFRPNIVELDIPGTGWVQASILESLPESRGSMTIEMVISDAVTDEVLAVAWQDQSDPRGGSLEYTTSVTNAHAFRLMIRSWADWLIAHLEEARG